MSRGLLRRRAALPLFLLALTAAACDGPAVPPPARAEVELLVAWTAETEDGFRVAAEQLFEAPLAELSGWSEEQLLRRDLALADEPFLRLHLMGRGEEIDASGVVEGAGGALTPLGDPPRELSPQARSLWLAYGGSEALEAEAYGRRSYLLRGSAPPEQEVLVWSRGDRRLELQKRSWTGKQRQEFLDPRLPEPEPAEPAPEEGGTDG